MLLELYLFLLKWQICNWGYQEGFWHSQIVLVVVEFFKFQHSSIQSLIKSVFPLSVNYLSCKIWWWYFHLCLHTKGDEHTNWTQKMWGLSAGTKSIKSHIKLKWKGCMYVVVSISYWLKLMCLLYISLPFETQSAFSTIGESLTLLPNAVVEILLRWRTYYHVPLMCFNQFVIIKYMIYLLSFFLKFTTMSQLNSWKYIKNIPIEILQMFVWILLLMGYGVVDLREPILMPENLSPKGLNSC